MILFNWKLFIRFLLSVRTKRLWGRWRALRTELHTSFTIQNYSLYSQYTMNRCHFSSQHFNCDLLLGSILCSLSIFFASSTYLRHSYFQRFACSAYTPEYCARLWTFFSILSDEAARNCKMCAILRFILTLCFLWNSMLYEPTLNIHANDGDRHSTLSRRLNGVVAYCVHDSRAELDQLAK